MVWEGSGGPPEGLGRIGGPTIGLGGVHEALTEFRVGSGVPLGGQRGRGWERGWEALMGGWEASGGLAVGSGGSDVSRCDLRGVERLSQRFGRGWEARPEVLEELVGA